MSLEGKVVGISWQDVWWDSAERDITEPWMDEDYIHFTYGLVLDDTDEFIRITHEWRPEKARHVGTTSIPKGIIRKLAVYGSGDIEAEGKEGPGGAGTAPAGRRKSGKRRSKSRSKSRSDPYRGDGGY